MGSGSWGVILCLQSDETISVWTKQKWKDTTIGRLSNYHVFLRLSPFSQSFFFFFLEVLMKTSDIVTCGQLTEESTAVKSVLGLVNGDERESGGRQLAVCPYTFRTRKFSRDARQTPIGIVEWFTWSLALWAAPAGVILLFFKKKKTNKIFSRKSMFLENNKIYVSFSF